MIPMPVRMKQRATGCLKGILSSRLPWRLHTSIFVRHTTLPRMARSPFGMGLARIMR